MKGLRADVIVLAVLLSVAAHVGLMFYARSRVMVHTVPSSIQASRKGPMRVTEAEPLPEPTKVEQVADSQADLEAPEAGDFEVPVPTVESVFPTAEPDLSDQPDLEMPSIAVVEAPEQVQTPLAKPVSSSQPPSESFDFSFASRPPTVEQPAPHAAADLGLGPTVLSPAAPEVPIDLAAPTPAAAEEIVPLEEKTDFKPAAEVMDEVDEKIVVEEKKAVRALVNVSDARDLLSAVDVRLQRAEDASFNYFRVQVSPKAVLKTVPKDVVVLIDASGSIGRDRMGSIRRAAKKILRSAANTGDRFNLVAFRDRFSYAFRTWQSCDMKTFEAADRWLNNVAPFGRTDVFSTISSVLTLPRDPKRPLIALLVTDGEANEGVSDTAEILSRFTALNDGLVSVYTYGVKSSANRELIDVLTRGNRGESFVFEGSRWSAGEGIEPLAERFRDPVLSDLRAVFPAAVCAEAYPRLLRNLYRGGSVSIVGRVPKGTREIAFSLKGLNGSVAYEGFFRLPLAAARADGSVKTDWSRDRAIDLRFSKKGK